MAGPFTRTIGIKVYRQEPSGFQGFSQSYDRCLAHYRYHSGAATDKRALQAAKRALISRLNLVGCGDWTDIDYEISRPSSAKPGADRFHIVHEHTEEF